jgi:hypothetical protein
VCACCFRHIFSEKQSQQVEREREKERDYDELVHMIMDPGKSTGFSGGRR